MMKCDKLNLVLAMGTIAVRVFCTRLDNDGLLYDDHAAFDGITTVVMKQLSK